MKKILMLALCFSIVSLLPAQQGEIPQEFLDEIEAELGIWIADNSAYMSDAEPYDDYRIRWEWAIGRKSIRGEMSARQGRVGAGPFWEFHKYWDVKAGKAVVMQFGRDGTVGTGYLEHPAADSSVLLQTFVAPNGSEYQSGHRTVYHDENSHTGTSYKVEDGEWTAIRSYLWKRFIADGE